MPAGAAEIVAEALGRVIKRVHDRHSPQDAPAVERFIRLFYAGIPAEDLLEHKPDDLYGAGLTFWHLIQSREPGTPKVDIINPSAERDGWHGPHTVIAMVNDDMPFLVDSTAAFLGSFGLTIHWMNHPIIGAIRDETGKLERVREPNGGGGVVDESCILIEVDRRTSPETLAALRDGLLRMLWQVRAAVTDWRATLDRVYALVDSLQATRSGVPVADVEEAVAFLRWTADNHFTFLGYREYRIARAEPGGAHYVSMPESALGILRDPELRPLGIPSGLKRLPPDVQAFLEGPGVLMITKSAMSSPVHRAAPMDLIGVKVFDDDGVVVGERRFVGLFTSSVYSRSVYGIPLLRRRVHAVLERSGLQKNGHAYKALEHILETLPRDELFQIGDEELLELGLGILGIEERQRSGLFVRRDLFERSVTCFVYVPRERYEAAIRRRVQRELEQAFSSTESSVTTQVSDSPLARMHFVVGTVPGQIPAVDLEALERRVIDATRSWEDHLRDALVRRFGEEASIPLAEVYGKAFPASYREDFTADVGAADVERLEAARAEHRLIPNLHHRPEERPGLLGLKLYNVGAPIPLSDLLPRLENLGLRVLSERPYRVLVDAANEPVWIHDMSVEDHDGEAIDLAAVRESFQEAFGRIWSGDAEDDAFNRLVLRAGLRWREVALLRAVSRYLRQTGIPFSQEYMQGTLTHHASIARDLFAYFGARFAPDGLPDHDVVSLRTEILNALDAVESLDEDRILRRFLNVIDSGLRTNYFQKAADGGLKPAIAIKLDSKALDGLPMPRPFVEIFVYSPRVEGIHLRGGKVARGGIRWSDRREDFRTEIHGLMKAQMVKNAVIVPVGAKGGFVVKQVPIGGERDVMIDEGIACYRIFISSLLDLTDNRVGDAVIPPPTVRRFDDDDPYLVVAADKGTARFSDIANEVAAEYGFWLGDAFASGGQAGYDHKAMGITARGAWESVRRHFRELGRDVQSEPFTVVGIGDMAGDVFGNGMLRSAQTKLVAAFNHRHIFLDPAPDVATSFAERERLFALPRSSWTDYDTTLLSAGGAILDRAAKSLTISAEVRAALGILAETLSPNDLIRAILRAPVDLLWFGGIGCFVRGVGERDADVGDHANDAVRIDARELRCRVVGEGANLAMTQAGRIEFARAGGRLNTDAIDNSAGVDCSDHEVNIKIVLNDLVARGDMTEKQRRAILADMTDEVAALVLRNNYLQTQAISVAEADAAAHLGGHARLMRQLERRGLLDRTVEGLPDVATIEERAQAGEGLTRPEIAVLLAYAKTTLFADLLESDAAEDPFLATDLAEYMPRPVREMHADAVAQHRLRREIIATSIANSLVNRGGIEFVSNVREYTGAPLSALARAYAVARHVLAFREFWRQIEALDNRVASIVQTEMLISVGRLVEHGTIWFLRNHEPDTDTSELVSVFSDGVSRLRAALDAVVSENERSRMAKRREKLEGVGVPPELAGAIAALAPLCSALDIVHVARNVERDVEEVGAAYFTLGTELRLSWLRYEAEAIADGNHWHHRAIMALVDDFYAQQRTLCQSALSGAADRSCAEAVALWLSGNEPRIHRIMGVFDEFSAIGSLDLAMLAVASREIRSVTGV